MLISAPLELHVEEKTNLACYYYVGNLSAICSITLAQHQMKKSYLLFALLAFLFSTPLVYGQSKTAQLSPEEAKLYDLLMLYRKENGLKSIPLSNALTTVAQTHCKDLVNNKPDIRKECNAHSWSDKGEWTSCCYTPDHKQATCMWNKPKELTRYAGNGFEIACGDSDPRFDRFVMTADYALKSWQESAGHNNVILNLAGWKNSEWKAIGIGIQGGFATVWFGKLVDEEGEPTLEE